MLPDEAIVDLFWGAIEATEEAICNALIAAETMVGRDGVTAHALPHDALVEIDDAIRPRSPHRRADLSERPVRRNIEDYRTSQVHSGRGCRCW